MTTTPRLTVPGLTATLDIGLDSDVGSVYRQVGEDDWHGQPFTLLEAIVDRAAARLVDVIVKETTEYKSIKAKVTERMTAAIDARVGPMLDEAFAQPIQRTNPYGEPMGGQTTTLRELVIAEARSEIGKPSQNDRYGSKATKLGEAIAAVTGQVLAKELAAEVANAKALIMNAARDAATEAITVAVTRAIGVPK